MADQWFIAGNAWSFADGITFLDGILAFMCDATGLPLSRFHIRVFDGRRERLIRNAATPLTSLLPERLCSIWIHFKDGRKADASLLGSGCEVSLNCYVSPTSSTWADPVIDPTASASAQRNAMTAQSTADYARQLHVRLLHQQQLPHLCEYQMIVPGEGPTDGVMNELVTRSRLFWAGVQEPDLTAGGLDLVTDLAERRGRYLPQILAENPERFDQLRDRFDCLHTIMYAPSRTFGRLRDDERASIFQSQRREDIGSANVTTCLLQTDGTSLAELTKRAAALLVG